MKTTLTWWDVLLGQLDPSSDEVVLSDYKRKLEDISIILEQV